MSFRSTLGRGVCAALFLAGVCLGQGVVTVEPNPVVQGGEVDVFYDNPNRPGEKVKITIQEIDPFNPTPRKQTVEITLDAEGHGKVKWSVPLDWPAAWFSGPEGDPVSVTFTPVESGE